MSADFSHEAFPSDETLASFIDGRLDEGTRERVLEHMSHCAECRDLVAMTAELNPAAPAAAKVTPMRRRWIVPAAAAAIAAGVMIALLTPIRTWFRPQRDDMASLIAAAPPYRTFEGRLAGFPYQPKPPAMRGAESKDDVDKLALYDAAEHVRVETRRNPDAENLHALAVALLLLRDVDAATSQIQAVLQREAGEKELQKAIAKSTDARLLNDASTIYAARAARDDSASDRLIAFDAADRAHKLEPRWAEAAWNRALAIESLHLTAQAIAAWRDYLAIDPHSPWAGEARAHIQSLQSATESDLWERERPGLTTAAPQNVADVTRRLPQQARTYAEEVLLADWARGGRSLPILRSIGAALAEEYHSDAIAKAVAEIESATPARRQQLAAGYIAYARGRQLQRDGAAADAAVAFRIASAAFGNARFAALSRLQIASCRFSQNDYATANTEIAPLLRDPDPSIAARAAWIRGLIEDQFGTPSEAFGDFETALQKFIALHETANQAAVRGLMASDLDRSGEGEKGIEEYARALALLQETGAQREQVPLEAGIAALHVGDASTAQLFLDALQPSPRPVFQAMYRTWSAVAAAKQGDSRRAKELLRDATARCEAIPDPATRERALANLDFARISAWRLGGMDRSAAELTRTIEFFQSRHSDAFLADLYTERGIARVRERDRAGAERDFNAAISILEREQPRLLRVDEGVRTLAATESPFDELTALLLDEHRDVDALECAERAGRLLFSSVYARAEHASNVFTVPAVQSVPVVQKALGNGVVAIRYALLPQRLAIWRITSQSVDSNQIPVTADQVRALVHAVRDDVLKVDSVARLTESSRPLAALLLDPWRQRVMPGVTLALVPGSDLDSVPFAALAFSNGELLLARHPLTFSATLSQLAASIRIDAERPSNGGALFVAASRPDPQSGDLPSLPATEDEVASASRAYGRATLLVRGMATRSRFLSVAPDAEIVHFAGHAIVNADAPLSSALVFAHDLKASALLPVRDIDALALVRVRLLVLAACSTGGGQRPGATIAAAFANRRIPSIVATLWNVDDTAISPLFATFHREIAGGASRAVALQRAEIALSRSPNPKLHRPSIWAAVRLIGVASPLGRRGNSKKV